MDYILKEYNKKLDMRIILLLTCGSTLGKDSSLKNIKDFMVL